MTRTAGRRRDRRGFAGLAVAIAAVVALVSCTPTGGGTTTATTTTTGGPTTTTIPGDDAFTVVFVGDSEPRMRGNTNAELIAYIDHLASYRTTTVSYFDHDGGRYRIDPELVILGGDISADRDTSEATDMPLWSRLYDHGIGFIAGFGNHDWDPPVWSDGSLGYSLAGHTSNQNTTGFTRATYRRTAAMNTGFAYHEVGPTAANGPITFEATYRGVRFVNFNTFLYQPSYRYPDGWPLTCNLAGGGAGCQTFVSAEGQIQRMEQLLPTDPSVPVVFVEHYPLSTPSGWWDDYGASGTTVAQKQDRLKGLMAGREHTALLAGHNHSASSSTFTYGGSTIREYVAPYFGGANGEDLTQGGGFIAMLVSPTRGILEVKTVPGGI